MPVIPQSVMAMVNRYFKPLLAWFSGKVYAELIGRAKDHLLVKLHEKLDLTARVAQEVREHVPLEQMTTLANCALHIHDIPQHEIETQSQAFPPDLEDADVSTLLLAQQVTPELVLTDDLDLRRAVESQGQAPMGSVGILLADDDLMIWAGLYHLYLISLPSR